MLAGHLTQVVKKVCALDGPQLRVGYLAEYLCRQAEDDALALLQHTVDGANRGDGDEGLVFLMCCVALCEPTLTQRRAQLAALAETREADVLAPMLKRYPPDEQDESRVPDFGLGRPITLGERKSLARKRDRQLIRRVLRDPHPDVIHLLLSNPALLETDVVTLCARRPLPPETALTVFRDLHWIVRPAVRSALLHNPHTPLDVALQLATLLTTPDAREVTKMNTLRPLLRIHCRSLLSLRNAAP